MQSVSLITHPSAGHTHCSLTAGGDQTTITLYIIGTSYNIEALKKGQSVKILTHFGLGQSYPLSPPSLAVVGQTLSNHPR